MILQLKDEQGAMRCICQRGFSGPKCENGGEGAPPSEEMTVTINNNDRQQPLIEIVQVKL